MVKVLLNWLKILHSCLRKKKQKFQFLPRTSRVKFTSSLLSGDNINNGSNIHYNNLEEGVVWAARCNGAKPVGFLYRVSNFKERLFLFTAKITREECTCRVLSKLILFPATYLLVLTRRYLHTQRALQRATPAPCSALF